MSRQPELEPPFFQAVTFPERFEIGSLQHRAYEAVMAPRRQAHVEAEIRRLNRMYERNRGNQPLSRYQYIHTHAQIPQSLRSVFEDVYQQLLQRQKKKKSVQDVIPKQPPKKPPRPPPPPPSFMSHVIR